MDRDGDAERLSLCDLQARWWVGFTNNAQLDHWWQLLCRDGFRHCFAFRALTDDVLILVNPLIHRIDNRSFLMRPNELIAIEKAAGARIATIELRVSPANPPRRGHLMTCASICAYSMGLDTRAITPYGLFREIMAKGGREL